MIQWMFHMILSDLGQYTWSPGLIKDENTISTIATVAIVWASFSDSNNLAMDPMKVSYDVE